MAKIKIKHGNLWYGGQLYQQGAAVEVSAAVAAKLAEEVNNFEIMGNNKINETAMETKKATQKAEELTTLPPITAEVVSKTK